MMMHRDLVAKIPTREVALAYQASGSRRMRYCEVENEDDDGNILYMIYIYFYKFPLIMILKPVFFFTLNRLIKVIYSKFSGVQSL